MKPVVFSRWRVMGPVVRSCIATEEGAKAGYTSRVPADSQSATLASVSPGRSPGDKTSVTRSGANGGHVRNVGALGGHGNQRYLRAIILGSNPPTAACPADACSARRTHSAVAGSPGQP